MLGEVLTADRHAVPGGRLRRPRRVPAPVRATSSTTAPTASSWPARRASRRRSPTTRSSSSSRPRSRRSAGGRRSIAGTGTYYDRRTPSTSRSSAHELGVDGFLVVTPYYNKPPQRGIVAHFQAIAEATDRPIVAYNIPQRVVAQHRAGDDRRSSRRSRTSRAVKQATTDPAAGATDRRGDRLDLYAGNDDLLLPVPGARRRRWRLRLHAPRRARR